MIYITPSDQCTAKELARLKPSEFNRSEALILPYQLRKLYYAHWASRGWNIDYSSEQIAINRGQCGIILSVKISDGLTRVGIGNIPSIGFTTTLNGRHAPKFYCGGIRPDGSGFVLGKIKQKMPRAYFNYADRIEEAVIEKQSRQLLNGERAIRNLQSIQISPQAGIELIIHAQGEGIIRERDLPGCLQDWSRERIRTAWAMLGIVSRRSQSFSPFSQLERLYRIGALLEDSEHPFLSSGV